MPERGEVISDRDAVRRHTAALAWSRSGAGTTRPTEIHALWEKTKGAKSSVFRLPGVGADGTDVIAKRIVRRHALRERAVYEDILPRLSVPSLRYYGYLEDEGPDGAEHCWLFVEDAGDRGISLDDPEHVAAVGAWLGELHGSALAIPASVDLPSFDLGYYWDYLEKAEGIVAALRVSDRVPPAYRGIAARFLSSCEAMRARRRDFAHLWGLTPRVFVHGDLQTTNVRLRPRGEGLVLAPFDWVGAGLASPAIDLQFFTRYSVAPDSYRDAVASAWPRLTLRDVERLSALGRLLRLTKLLYWSVMWCQEGGEAVEPTGRYLDRFARYEGMMNQALLKLA